MLLLYRRLRVDGARTTSQRCRPTAVCLYVSLGGAWSLPARERCACRLVGSRCCLRLAPCPGQPVHRLLRPLGSARQCGRPPTMRRNCPPRTLEASEGGRRRLARRTALVPRAGVEPGGLGPEIRAAAARPAGGRIPGAVVKRGRRPRGRVEDGGARSFRASPSRPWQFRDSGVSPGLPRACPGAPSH